LNLQLNGEGVVQPEWSAAEPVGLSLSACPRGDWFSYSQDHLVWVWGEGTSQLTIAARDLQTGEWSLPQNFSFNFTLDIGQSISMGELSAVLNDDTLAVIGSDAGSGEIWMTSARLDPSALSHPAVSPWSDDLIVTTEQGTVGMPSIAMDRDGRSHMVYLVGSQPGPVFTAGSSMFYSRSDQSSATRPVPVSSFERDIYRDPSLVYAPSNDELHLVWSGGQQGEIMYTRANASEAASLGWLSPVILSAQGGEAMPQIVVDSYGKLHVLYIITLNEARGVYITSSEDGGKSWSEPAIVFDAAGAQWQMVDHPTFGAAPDGTLYAAWVHTALPGLGSPKGIYSSISKDSGITWENPILLAGAGFDQPQIAITSTTIHVLMKNTATGGLFYRWGNLEEITPTGEGWSTSASAPGSANLDGSFDVSATSTNLFLAAAGSDGNILYSTWGQNNSSVGWTSQERVFPDSVVVNTSTSLLPDFQAAASGPAGLLGLVFARETISQDAEGQDTYASSLVLKFRSIPVAEEYSMLVKETPVPLPQTLEETQPTLTVVVPTPTPDLNAVSGQDEEPLSPLVYAGGFAALLIGGVFVVYTVRTRSRPR
jgi:hypothetical protein